MNSEFKQAFLHLKKDEVMKYLIDKFQDKISFNEYSYDNFALSLSNLIIDQQISFKAAKTIKERFALLIKDLSFNEICELDNNKIQAIGISFRKVDYIKNIFKYFIKNANEFSNLNVNEMTKELISIKGVGKWTVEMFLMFELKKLNIFSKGDIALINSVKRNYNIKDLEDKELNKLIKIWSPYNTIACLLLWKSIEEKIFFNHN
ncbi:MAG: hypothetical protein L7S44_06035 [Flavobacteriaceae bacterium]|nr:hypothetical protein [Flavobacteriaceae bacterium]